MTRLYSDGQLSLWKKENNLTIAPSPPPFQLLWPTGELQTDCSYKKILQTIYMYCTCIGVEMDGRITTCVCIPVLYAHVLSMLWHIFRLHIYKYIIDAEMWNIFIIYTVYIMFLVLWYLKTSADWLLKIKVVWLQDEINYFQCN